MKSGNKVGDIDKDIFDDTDKNALSSE